MHALMVSTRMPPSPNMAMDVGLKMVSIGLVMNKTDSIQIRSAISYAGMSRSSCPGQICSR
jgi:hypothetical protein